MMAVMALAGISIETFLIACFSPYQIERFVTLKAGPSDVAGDSTEDAGDVAAPDNALDLDEDMVVTGMF
jgi:hypothetical protein